MALTRLARIGRIKDTIQTLSIVFQPIHSRQITSSTICTSESKDVEAGVKPRRKKSKVKFCDLPSPTSEPLPEWNGYVSEIKADVKSLPTKPTRKRKQKQDLNPKKDTVDLQEPEINVKVTKSSILAQEILSNLERFPHCILLTRVGQFYESYFDQASEVASLLNIKLTSRKWGGKRVAMCGFPLIHLDRHLKTLIDQNKKFVAMCEEFPTYDNHGGKEFERRVTRIITPGTLIDESFLNPMDNNFLLAITVPRTPFEAPSFSGIGLAWIDVSTGEFFSKQCPLDALADELARLSPREVVLHPSITNDSSHPVTVALKDHGALISYAADHSLFGPGAISISDLLQCQRKLHLEPQSDADGVMESSAIQLLTRYLSETLLEHMPRLAQPLHEAAQDRMQIDSQTIQGLEIRENLYERGTKGSLFSVVKRTITNSGTRLLARWLCAPSTSIEEIERRHTLVSFFQKRPHFCSDIIEILKKVDDVTRLCQSFLMGRATFTDLLCLKSSIQLWNELQERSKHEMAMESLEQSANSDALEWDKFQGLLAQFHELHDLLGLIVSAIPDTEPAECVQFVGDSTLESPALDDSIQENRTSSINPQFSPKLLAIYKTLQALNQEKQILEETLQNTLSKQIDRPFAMKQSQIVDRPNTEAPSLSLRSAPNQGYCVHVSRAKRDKTLLDQNSDFVTIGETLSTKTYVYRPWTELGLKISSNAFALSLAEKEAFESIRITVTEHIDSLRENSHIIDELDVLLSFAKLATEMNFVRPEMTSDLSFHIINGRHPVVEMGLLSNNRQFTPNSTEMTTCSNLHIITGPNMAGKSTFLRQNALISILAQVGSFVPADYARIGIVDKVFSRIGARDDLYRDRSTFMIEMLETGHILKRATEKSLVIMDEVGRGTTVRDGIAIAFSTLHHLATVNNSRCLFATHFHELAELVGNVGDIQGSGLFGSVRFYCSDVSELSDDRYTYSYHLKPGINHDSHGLKVARLAGLPLATIAVAEEVLARLKGR